MEMNAEPFDPDNPDYVHGHAVGFAGTAFGAGEPCDVHGHVSWHTLLPWAVETLAATGNDPSAGDPSLRAVSVGVTAYLDGAGNPSGDRSGKHMAFTPEFMDRLLARDRSAEDELVRIAGEIGGPHGRGRYEISCREIDY